MSDLQTCVSVLSWLFLRSRITELQFVWLLVNCNFLSVFIFLCLLTMSLCRSCCWKEAYAQILLSHFRWFRACCFYFGHWGQGLSNAYLSCVIVMMMWDYVDIVNCDTLHQLQGFNWGLFSLSVDQFWFSYHYYLIYICQKIVKHVHHTSQNLKWQLHLSCFVHNSPKPESIQFPII